MSLDDAFRQVRDRVKETFVDLGEKELKNIARPVRVYGVKVGWAGSEIASRHSSADPAALERASIAVLPFVNMSGNTEQEYFADGISEDIITSLSKLAQLFVIARNSSFTFKGKNVHIVEVGKNLGVHYVVEGSVRKSGTQFRITAQLIDATTGGHLWAERFDRELTDIFAVQDEVAAKIVSALSLNLAPGDLKRIASARTDNLEAYDCYLRGRALWQRSAKEPCQTCLFAARETWLVDWLVYPRLGRTIPVAPGLSRCWQRARGVSASRIVRPLRPRCATCPSPRREACGAFGPR